MEAVPSPAIDPMIIAISIDKTGLVPFDNKTAQTAPPSVKLPSMVRSANPSKRKEIVIPPTKILNIRLRNRISISMINRIYSHSIIVAFSSKVFGNSILNILAVALFIISSAFSVMATGISPGSLFSSIILSTISAVCLPISK